MHKFAPTDNYLKIDADRAQFLVEKFGDVVDENTKYIFNKELLEDEKIGEEISKLIESSKVLTAKQYLKNIGDFFSLFSIKIHPESTF